MEITDLQKLCENGSIRWTGHILKRLMQRGIFQASVVQAIRSGEIIEQYPDDYPFPSCLILGFSVKQKYIHVVIGSNLETLWVITAYYPDLNKWEQDLRVRKEEPI